MTMQIVIESGSNIERLSTLANLLELALHAPQDEITHDARVALQCAAREVVVLSDEVSQIARVATHRTSLTQKVSLDTV